MDQWKGKPKKKGLLRRRNHVSWRERKRDGWVVLCFRTRWRDREVDRRKEKKGKEKKERMREKEGSPIKKWELGGKQSNDNNKKN